MRLLAFQTQGLLQSTDKLVQNDQQFTTRELETELLVSKGSVNNIVYALGHSKVCSCLVPRHKTDCCQELRKEVLSGMLFFKRLRMKAFCHRSSLGIKYGSITLNCRRKARDSQWNCITYCFPRRSLRGYPFSRYKSIAFLGIIRKLLS